MATVSALKVLLLPQLVTTSATLMTVEQWCLRAEPFFPFQNPHHEVWGRRHTAAAHANICSQNIIVVNVRIWFKCQVVLCWGENTYYCPSRWFPVSGRDSETEPSPVGKYDDV